mgnify:CR=1 FL=1
MKPRRKPVWWWGAATSLTPGTFSAVGVPGSSPGQAYQVAGNSWEKDTLAVRGMLVRNTRGLYDLMPNDRISFVTDAKSSDADTHVVRIDEKPYKQKGTGRARAGSLRSSEMSDPTITLTNLGDKGVDAVFGVIYPPQVAIVGFGKPAQRVVVVDGGIRVATTVRTSLAADHRASDGARGALFLAEINRLLQQPEEL